MVKTFSKIVLIAAGLIVPALANAEQGCIKSDWATDSYKNYYFEFQDSDGNTFTPFFAGQELCEQNLEKIKAQKTPVKICGCEIAMNKSMMAFSLIGAHAPQKAMLYCYNIDSNGVAQKQFIEQWAWQENDSENVKACENARVQSEAGSKVLVE
jgi:hypothetical protein